MSKYYEYDLEKANWLMKNGCIAIGMGRNSKTLTEYIVFKVSKKMKEASYYYDKHFGNKNVPNNSLTRIIGNKNDPNK